MGVRANLCAASAAALTLAVAVAITSNGYDKGSESSSNTLSGKLDRGSQVFCESGYPDHFIRYAPSKIRGPETTRSASYCWVKGLRLALSVAGTLPLDAPFGGPVVGKGKKRQL